MDAPRLCDAVHWRSEVEPVRCEEPAGPDHHPRFHVGYVGHPGRYTWPMDPAEQRQQRRSVPTGG